jgi:hypothetical protein
MKAFIVYASIILELKIRGVIPAKAGILTAKLAFFLQDPASSAG